MPVCSIVKCGARKNKNHPQLTLHRFPKNEGLRKKWLEATGEENINPRHKEWHVCSLHFEGKCFNRTLDVTRLRENSVPTIFSVRSVGQASTVKKEIITDTFPSASAIPDVKVQVLGLRCCVPGCDNDSRYISESQGITFHLFPKHPSIRTAWLQVVDKKASDLKEENAVCSEHFLLDDFYKTKSGVKKIRDGAVPLVDQVCRICLVMDGKMFPIRQSKLEQAYEHLTGLSICDEDGLPQKLCSECAHRLLSCNRFRHKSLRANSLMMEIVRNQNSLTKQSLKTINRLNSQLTSSLFIKHYPPDHCDLNLEDIVEPKKEESSGEVTKEVDVTLKEVGTDETDKNRKLLVPDSRFVQEKATNDKIIDDFDVDYIQSDIDYSTDDGFPLQNSEKENGKKTNGEIKTDNKNETRDPKQQKNDNGKQISNNDLLKALFTTTNTTHEEEIAEIQNRKDSDNYKKSEFKCNECFKGFTNNDAFRAHMSRHTKQFGDYQCDICKIYFNNLYALKRHITGNHTQKFSCNQCTFVTKYINTATKHGRWHKGLKYPCAYCPEVFSKITTYMGHKRKKHPSDFVCQLCGYSFVSEKGIWIHKRFKHRLDNKQIPEDGPLCVPCNIRFASSQALTQHIIVSARHTADEKMSNKPKARRKARRPGQKGDGSKVATNPIACELCDVQLKNSCAYNTHFRQMHPGKNRTLYPTIKTPYMCELCGKIFKYRALMNYHRGTHTGERPFVCNVCGKAFQTRQYLQLHEYAHTAKHDCPVCGKQFSRPCNRERHMLVHTDVRPFECNVCGKAFKSLREKRDHIAYVHMKKPLPKRNRKKRRADGRTGQTKVSADESERDEKSPVDDIDSIMED